jgi:hypothetical protein
MPMGLDVDHGASHLFDGRWRCVCTLAVAPMGQERDHGCGLGVIPIQCEGHGGH